MKHVARDDHEFGRELDHPVHGAHKCGGHVGFALIDARRRQPLILTEPEMEVGEVYEAHVRDTVSREARPAQRGGQAAQRSAGAVCICCVTVMRMRNGAAAPLAPSVTSSVIVAFQSDSQPRRRSICIVPVRVPAR